MPKYTATEENRKQKFPTVTSTPVSTAGTTSNEDTLDDVDNYISDGVKDEDMESENEELVSKKRKKLNKIEHFCVNYVLKTMTI